MDDPLYRRFFTQPRPTLQRRYEILRAHFVEERSLQSIAEQFGLNYYTIRALVRDFRVQCRAGRIPPFSLRRTEDGRFPTAPPNRHDPKSPPSPIAGS